MNKRGTIKQLEETNDLVSNILAYYEDDIVEKFIDKDKEINRDLCKFLKDVNKLLRQFCDDLEELKYAEDEEYAEDD